MDREEAPAGVSSRAARITTVAIILVGGLAPLVLFQLFVGGGPGVSVDEAKLMIAEPDRAAVLVDISPEAGRDKRHSLDAVSWPYASIMVARSTEDVPKALRARTLLLVCQGGLHSASAAEHLASLSIADALSINGGMQEWVAFGARRYALAGDSSAEEEVANGAYFREAPFHEQLAAVLSAFAVKPAYMLMALVLLVVLLRARSADLRAVRWALGFFFVGEAFCTLNYICYEEASLLFEYLHSFPMAVTFGFTAYAFFEAFDRRVLKYSSVDEKCAALGLCRSCFKHTSVPCGLQRMFLLLIPVSAVLAFMPLAGRLETASYNTLIFGTPYNYSHNAASQLLELRWCPLAAIVLFAVAFLLLVLKRTNAVAWSKIFFAAGTGALGFALLRWVLLAGYGDDLVWFVFWEEVTEFMYVAGVAWVLWLFRKGLFAKNGSWRGQT